MLLLLPRQAPGHKGEGMEQGKRELRSPEVEEPRGAIAWKVAFSGGLEWPVRRVNGSRRARRARAIRRPRTFSTRGPAGCDQREGPAQRKGRPHAQR